MERNDTEAKMFTVQEAAVKLRVSTKTIRNWINEGRLRARRIGRPLYITEQDILAALKDREARQQKTDLE